MDQLTGKPTPPALKRGRIFLLAAFAVPVLFAAIVAASLYAAAIRGPVQFTNGGTTHIYFWTKKKDALVREALGSRIVLFGGSGVLYSVRASSLTAKLGGPVINMGLHAGLGLDYLLYHARSVLRPNDVAVLFIEYPLYAKEIGDWTLSDFAIPFDSGYLRHIGPGASLGLAGRITPREFLQKMRGGWFGTRETGAQSLELINGSGDFVSNSKGEQNDLHRKSLAAMKPYDDTNVSAVQTRKLLDFLEWCRSNGVHVVAAYPAFLDWPEYHQPPRAGYLAQVAELYRSHGVPSLGNAEEFMFPKVMFFDTAFHLNADGADVMTDLVARRLKTILRCDLFREWGNDKPPECSLLRRSIIVDFAREGFPGNATSITGFSEREEWGRWTDGPKASIRVAHPLDTPFRVDLVMTHVFAEKAPLQITVRAGTETRTFIAQTGTQSLQFDGSAGNDRLQIEIPEQHSPAQLGLNEDARKLGLGISRIEIHPGVPK